MKQGFIQLFSKLLIFVMAALLISEFVPALEIVKIICEIETNGVCFKFTFLCKNGHNYYEMLIYMYIYTFLILTFRRVLIVISYLLCKSPAFT